LVTDRKKLEKAMISDLNFSITESEQMPYLASHNLQEPLLTICNFGKLLDKNYSGKIDREFDRHLKSVLKATSEMQKMIKQLLDYFMIGRNSSFEAVDCNKILEEVIANVKASIEKSKAKIIFAPLPILVGYKLELIRLFQNLISNAIKFRKKKLNLKIEITVEQKDTEYLFAIKDNGIGIEKKYKDRIFLIFQRLNDVTEYSGTGIELAACKKIVALHHGKIWMESEFGEGCTFYFTIFKEDNMFKTLNPDDVKSL
jgi:light-regulated signal transduction histidine kinase (bacteriophytochrome)